MSKEIIFSNYKLMILPDLVKFCKENNINYNGNKGNILFEIIKFHINKNDYLVFDGCIEMINNTYGFLRDIHNNFAMMPYDIYVHPRFVKEYNLKYGDMIECTITIPKSDEQKLFTLSKVLSINGSKKFHIRNSFEDFTPTYPKEQMILENPLLKKEYNIICRAIDLVCPIGFGQRTLIVAPPKTGKTTILHSIASSIAVGYKEVKLILVLVGERPEEVTEMKKIVPQAEIVFSTFDEPAENQIRMTEIIIERAKRLVEDGYKVVILLDSVTRLVRSYNYAVPSSGKILTGGVDPAALLKPKKFFGSARNTEEGQSLTIISTCLTETGSKMDDFIFEELKGTGNAEIMLNRDISNKRIFPAIDIAKSGARRADLFVVESKLNKIRMLETFLSNMDDQSEAIKLLIDRIRINPGNRELLINMN